MIYVIDSVGGGFGAVLVGGCFIQYDDDSSPEIATVLSTVPVLFLFCCMRVAHLI
jgi:hypothetical protein